MFREIGTSGNGSSFERYFLTILAPLRPLRLTGRSGCTLMLPYPKNGQRLIIQRPTQIAFATSQLLTLGLLVAIIIYLAGGIFSWFILSYRVIRPLEYLETYSERIRWRGHLSAAEQKQIDKLAQRTDQLGNLTRSLEAMQEDTEKRLVQLATLLATSRVVAASLESRAVIDNYPRSSTETF